MNYFIYFYDVKQKLNIVIMKALNGWLSKKEGVLPDSVVKHIKDNNGFKYPGGWFYDVSFLKEKISLSLQMMEVFIKLEHSL